LLLFSIGSLSFGFSPLPLSVSTLAFLFSVEDVRVWLARSLSAANFPDYPTNATIVGSDFDSSLPIHPILLP
jgi:hypothetical protein